MLNDEPSFSDNLIVLSYKTFFQGIWSIPTFHLPTNSYQPRDYKELEMLS
jgi:hypothetical protein